MPGSPILLSFFARTETSRYDTLVCRMAGLTRVVPRGRKEPVKVGDHLTWSYNHLFTWKEAEAELREAGIRMVDFGEVGGGHAVGVME